MLGKIFLLLTFIGLISCFPKQKQDLEGPPKPDYGQCGLLSDKERLDCYPRGNSNQELCESRGCCWSLPKGDSPAPDGTIPYCFYQPQAPSYSFKSLESKDNGVVAQLQRLYGSPYIGQDVVNVKMDVTYETSKRIHIKLTDADDDTRWESPYPRIEEKSYAALDDMDYEFNINQDQPGFTVKRKSDETVVFDASDLADFVFSDQFLQQTLKLHASHVYGIGDHQGPLSLDLNYKTYTLWNHDTPPPSPPRDGVNLYGAHAFYLAMEDSANAHGVFLKNSNAMDILVRPDPSITFRTIGGVLDFYVFLGPTPTNVISQYLDLVGRPVMPPLWGLGFHLCRWGFTSAEDAQEIMQKNLDAGVPIDTMWNDLDYMDKNNDFTYNKKTFAGLPNFVKSLHEQGRHYVPLIDPGVSAGETRGTYPPYDVGVEMDTLIKTETGEVYVGKVWNANGRTAWPDFTHPKAQEYWTQMFKMLHDEIPIDGAWIDMNDISNFYDGLEGGCPNNALENPPYVPRAEGSLQAHTLCLSAKHHNGSQYNIHNIYGINEAEATYSALAEIRGKRPFIISRSTFPGHGRYAGHWSGDDFSTWDAMRWTIPHLLIFNMLGVPLMGSDICGFNDDSNEELCNRWVQLGSFYPFSRNHNTLGAKAQDPVAMGPQVVESSVTTLRIRYSLLPYLYTLFWRAHVNGTTVARPLFLEFPQDVATYEIDKQFLWGSALLITPVLEETSDYVRGYLPKGVWYCYYAHHQVLSEGQTHDFNVTKTTIPLFVRGGHILPSQEPEQTTTETRKNKITLIAAADENEKAWGELYWDDGDTIDSYEKEEYSLITFVMKKGELTATVNHKDELPPNLDTVNIWGVKDEIAEVTVNGKKTKFAQDDYQLTINAGDISWDDGVTIKWIPL